MCNVPYDVATSQPTTAPVPDKKTKSKISRNTRLYICDPRIQPDSQQSRVIRSQVKSSQVKKSSQAKSSQKEYVVLFVQYCIHYMMMMMMIHTVSVIGQMFHPRKYILTRKENRTKISILFLIHRQAACSTLYLATQHSYNISLHHLPILFNDSWAKTSRDRHFLPIKMFY